MYKVILVVLFSQYSIVFGSVETSYHDQLFSAKAQLDSGKTDVGRQGLLEFVSISRNLTKEYNIGYALSAAELLIKQLGEKDAAGEILKNLFADINTFVDSSLYDKAAELFDLIGEHYKAKAFRDVVQKQKVSAWGGEMVTPPEETDYDALGVPNPNSQEAVAPTAEELASGQAALELLRQMRRQP